MTNEEKDPEREEVTLISSDAPFNFRVTVKGAWAGGDMRRSFVVTGADAATGSIKTKEYHLPDREHKSYRHLFEELAQDFGVSSFRDRIPRTQPTFMANYRALLNRNVSPRILYGYGDPAVLRVKDDDMEPGGARYYLVATSNDAPDSFPILRSKDLLDWEFVDFVFPRGKKPEWAADGEFISDYWAPEMHKVGDEFRLYFAARERTTRELGIGLAKSSSPEGPFVSTAGPIIARGIIDPHLFVEDDKTTYLYYKEDNNDRWPGLLNRLLHMRGHLLAQLFPRKEDRLTASFMQTLWPWIQTLEPMERFLVQQPLIDAVTARFSGFYERLKALADEQEDPTLQDLFRAILSAMRTPMYVQRLSSDGSVLVGERTKVIENDQEWEAHLVEGEWMWKHGGKYYLFYAGNDFSTEQYGIGVAISDSPLGPFKKMPEPLLTSTAEWSGPGHPSVAIGPDGATYMFLHAYFPGRAGYKEFRALLSIAITFEEDRVLLRPTRDA